MRKITIKNSYEGWHILLASLKPDLVNCIAEAEATKSHEDMLICALLEQVVHKIELRLLSSRPSINIGFTYAEAMAIHQAYCFDMIYAQKETYANFLLMEMYAKIDQQAF